VGGKLLALLADAMRWEHADLKFGPNQTARVVTLVNPPPALL
jgi:hypothetical protein